MNFAAIIGYIVFVIMTGGMFVSPYLAEATEIALVQTMIPEGAFSILLYKPQRSELPLREKDSGITIVTYTYQSSFPAFDISYAASFTDWTASKRYEIRKYGSPLMSVDNDLDTNVEGLKVILQQRLKASVKLLTKKEISYGKYSGRDAAYEFIISGSRYIVAHRVYIVGYKEYSYQVVYPVQYERYAQPLVFLNSFQLESESSNKMHAEKYCTSERKSHLSYMINTLKKIISKPLEKDLANTLLQKMPSSKPYIKNGEYLGQLVMNEGISIGMLTFTYDEGYTDTSNFAIGPLSYDAVPYVLECLIETISINGREIKKNVYDLGDGVAVDIYAPSSDTVSAQAFRMSHH